MLKRLRWVCAPREPRQSARGADGRRGPRRQPVVRKLGRLLLSGPPVIAALIGLFLVGCAATEGKPGADEAARPQVAEESLRNAEVSLPSYVTAEIRDAYEFALANPDKLKYVPCYCGCGLTIAHRSNLDCYIAGIDEGGKVAFTDHAVHCDVCVEITRDVKRLSAERRSLKEIRAYVDQTHGQKGPPTNTSLPTS